MKVKVSIYEQDCCGVTQWRVMRTDGGLIFDRIETDFPDEQEAEWAILGWCRRNLISLEQVAISVHRCNANGLRLPAVVLEL